MGIRTGDRKNNTVVMQFEVPNVKDFFEYLQKHEGIITFGPSFEEDRKFWYGGFLDLEGNPFWAVDENCP